MGKRLYETERVFRSTVDACDETARALGMAEELEVSVGEALRRGWRATNDDPRASRHVELVCLGVIQLALVDLWESLGVAPDATLSVSLGEMTAPYAAGALTLEESVAVLLSVNRVATERSISAEMLAVAADQRTARDLCWGAPGTLYFLGTNDPNRSILYAVGEDLEPCAAYLAGHGVLEHRYKTDSPYHTMLAAFDLPTVERELAHLRPTPTRVPMFSAVTGRDVAGDARFDAAFFHWMIRQPFWFAEASAAALAGEPPVILSIGASPVTVRWIRATAGALEVPAQFVDSITPGQELESWRAARRALRRGSWLRRRRAVKPADRSEAGSARDPGELDLASPEVVRDPFGPLARLRAEGPVHHLPRHDMWLVVAYAEVREAFGAPERFSSRLLAPADPVVLAADPPEHSSARRELAARHLSPAEVERIGSVVHEAARRRLAELARRAEFDVLSEYAAPLGELVAGELIGLDAARLSRVRLLVGDPERDPQELIAKIGCALADVLPDPKPADRLIWLAGTTTTKRAIVAAILLMLEDFELRRQVRSDRTLVPALIEEAVRLHPPERMIARVTTAEVEIGGRAIPPGSVVQLCIAAANRDPDVFDEPDRVLLGRRTPHLSFGSGPHRCIGANLARVEARAALDTFLGEVPGFRPTHPPCALRWIPSLTTHGVERLIVGTGAERHER